MAHTPLAQTDDPTELRSLLKANGVLLLRSNARPEWWAHADGGVLHAAGWWNGLKFGEAATRCGVSHELVAAALRLQEAKSPTVRGRRLGDILADLGAVGGQQLKDILRTQVCGTFDRLIESPGKKTVSFIAGCDLDTFAWRILAGCGGAEVADILRVADAYPHVPVEVRDASPPGHPLGLDIAVRSLREEKDVWLALAGFIEPLVARGIVFKVQRDGRVVVVARHFGFEPTRIDQPAIIIPLVERSVLTRAVKTCAAYHGRYSGAGFPYHVKELISFVPKEMALVPVVGSEGQCAGLIYVDNEQCAISKDALEKIGMFARATGLVLS